MPLPLRPALRLRDYVRGSLAQSAGHLGTAVGIVTLQVAKLVGMDLLPPPLMLPLTLVLGSLATAWAVHSAVPRPGGVALPPGDSLRLGLRRLGSVMGATLLSSAWVSVLAIMSTAPAWLWAARSVDFTALQAAAADPTRLLGEPALLQGLSTMMLAALPGVAVTAWVGMRLGLCAAVAAAEARPLTAVMRVSWERSRGTILPYYTFDFLLGLVCLAGNALQWAAIHAGGGDIAFWRCGLGSVLGSPLSQFALALWYLHRREPEALSAS